jgi:hypothetical protein
MAVMIVSSQCRAIVVDGRIDPAEGYNFLAPIPPANLPVEPIPTDVQAKLYLGQQGSSLYLAFEIPFGYTDNTYGVNSSEGWPEGKGHLFNDLIQSDQMVLMGEFNGKTINITIDYLEEKDMALERISTKLRS